MLSNTRARGWLWVCLASLLATCTERPPQVGDGCPTSQAIPALHRNIELFQRLLSESDARLCAQSRSAPQDPSRVVVSFSRLLGPDEVSAFVRDMALQPLVLETRHGWARGERPAPMSLAMALEEDRQRFQEWLAGQAAHVEGLRAADVPARDRASANELRRLDEEVRRARDTGPLYGAVVVMLPAAGLPTLFHHPAVRYVIDASLMAAPRGVDPETGDWE